MQCPVLVFGHDFVVQMNGFAQTYLLW